MMVVSMAIITITPYLSRVIPSYAILLLFTLWAFDTASHCRRRFLVKDGYGQAKWLIILLVWQLFLSVIGYSSLKYTNIINRVPVYCIPIICSYCVNYYSYREIKILFTLLLIITVVNLLDNIRLEIVSPGFFTSFRRSDVFFAATNGGTSSFVNAILSVIPVMYILFSNSSPKPKRNIYLVIIIISTYYIVFINPRATTLFILIFYILMLSFERNSYKFGNNRNLRFFLFVLLFIIIVIIIVPALEFLAGILPDRLSVRIMDVVNSITSRQIDDTGTSSLYSRWLLSQASLRTWLSSPLHFLLGIGEDVAQSGSIDDLLQLGIGQHSEIFDFLAKYGAVGAFLLYKAMSSIFKFIFSLSNDLLIKSEVRVVLMGYVLMSALNNSLIACYMMIIFVMLPLAVVIVTRKKKLSYEQ